MSKKLDRNKLTTMIISGVLVAGAGTYAFAAQYNQPQFVAEPVSSVVSSEAVSSEPVSSAAESVQSAAESVVESSAPKEEVSSMESAVTSAPAETQAPASQPEQPAGSVSESNTSSYVASLVVDVCYYDIIDPNTGKHIGAREQGYFELQAQLKGDAGKVPPDQSTACQAALAQYKAKQAAASATNKK